MEWSRPNQQGVTPGPRAGHAGVTVGENWFIAGGGDNKNGIILYFMVLYRHVFGLLYLSITSSSVFLLVTPSIIPFSTPRGRKCPMNSKI